MRTCRGGMQGGVEEPSVTSHETMRSPTAASKKRALDEASTSSRMACRSDARTATPAASYDAWSRGGAGTQ